MPIYTCYFRDPQGAITSFDFIECDSDAEAVTRAGVLLSQRDLARSVEVVEGQRMLTVSGAIRPRKTTPDSREGGAPGA